MRTKNLLSVLGLGIGALAAGPALADAHHGSACKTNHWDQTRVEYNRNGVYNNSASDAKVICAGWKAHNPFGSNELRVTFVDPTDAEDAKCVVYLMSEPGQLLFQTTFQTTGVSGAPMIVKTSLPPDAGFVEFECTLPSQKGRAAFHIMNYTITP